jgi:hypothetical protein
MIMNNGLRNLRAQFGGRSSSVQLRDANARRQEASTETCFIYTSRLVFVEGGKRIEVFASGELACISILGEFDVPLFTVNSPDRGGFTTFSIGQAMIGSSDYEVFTKDGNATNSQNRLLRSVELADLVSVHPFRRGEALHFYRNCLILYARVEDLSTVLVRRMVALAEVIPAENETVDDLELPARFADLADILRDWGMTDDLERSDKIRDASEQELRQLLAAVEPRLAAISSYLNDHEENPGSNVADNLGAIMDATFEARAALVSRTAQNN